MISIKQIIFSHFLICFISSASGSTWTQWGSIPKDWRHHQIEISHHWGPYSPWFSVPSEIPLAVPPQCNATFVQVLSRHGARHPTAHRSTSYHSTINKIHECAEAYSPNYAFIRRYRYSLGADTLTTFGEQEMIKSGTQFYDRYPELSASSTPFIRASGRGRVVESAHSWAKGFRRAKHDSENPELSHEYPVTIIIEGENSNNTLHHGQCIAFEDTHAELASSARAQWAAIFVPPIQERVNRNLPGANLTIADTLNLMDLCPYITVASKYGTMSQFCSLFSIREWQQYDYHHSLTKFYDFGAGHPLGPTQGVGFTNELIARLTNKPVVDHTSTNRTLDQSSATFPLGRTLYADFSHDSVMTSVFFALGLYSTTHRLKKTQMQSPRDTHGYSAAYTVPFAARAYIEKLRCTDNVSEEMVRVIINDRVLPLETCNGDRLGRCALGDFIESLAFASQGGRWDQCFSQLMDHQEVVESGPGQVPVDFQPK